MGRQSCSLSEVEYCSGTYPPCHPCSNHSNPGQSGKGLQRVSGLVDPCGGCYGDGVYGDRSSGHCYGCPCWKRRDCVTRLHSETSAQWPGPLLCRDRPSDECHDRWRGWGIVDEGVRSESVPQRSLGREGSS